MAELAMNLNPDILARLVRARKAQKTECRCGPVWDFEECLVCIVKKELADDLLGQLGLGPKE